MEYAAIFATRRTTRARGVSYYDATGATRPRPAPRCPWIAAVYNPDVNQASLLRLLDLIRVRLHAADARVEIGGRPPADTRLLSAALGPHSRIVVVFDEPLDADASETTLRAKLEAIVSGFTGFGEASLARETGGRRRVPASARLDAALESLAERAGAAVAFVLDRQSPVIWGSSLTNEEPARVREHRRRVDRAAARLRAPELAELRREVVRADDYGLLARGFANQYWTALVFTGPFSELRADGALVHALPMIERLVLSLPPIDPGPGGGGPRADNVVLLPPRRD